MEELLIHYTKAQFQCDLEKFIADAVRKINLGINQSNKPEYLTREEVSEKLHVSFPTLHRLNKEGILKAQKIGGRVLYKVSEVEKAMNPIQPIKYRRTSHV